MHFYWASKPWDLSRAENKNKSEELVHERDKSDIQNHVLQRAVGAIQESYMLTTSKMIRHASCILICLVFANQTANAKELFLANQGSTIKIQIQGTSVTATKTDTQEKLTVELNLANLLLRAEEIFSIEKRKNIHPALFIILSREPSRPNAMGRGFCGAGYEDIVLLIELKGKKLELRDRYKLQSYVDSVSIYTEVHVENPAELLALQADNSYLYRLVDNEAGQGRRLMITNKKLAIEKSAFPMK